MGLKGRDMFKSRIFFCSALLALLALFNSVALAQTSAPKIAKATVNAPVTLIDNGDSWTMDNGIVKLSLLKRNGNLTSLVYHGIEVLTRGQYWEQTPQGTIAATVTIDPKTNGGEGAEVSVKGVYAGDSPAPPAPPAAPLAPGAPRPAAGAPRGSRGLDIETRFTLERGSSGF
jgi:hypothetical protein